MLAPLSWLKEYIDITLSPKELAERLTEVGINCEKIYEEKGDTILELEITPNRPDCLSLMGVVHEIAAIENKPIKYPHNKIDVIKIKPKATKPLKIKTDSKINPRFTGIIIDGVFVKESPKWLIQKLEKMGQRSINNIVDITNFVMLETGNPLHAFDYDKIEGHQLHVHQTKGGEKFRSVDNIEYILPKDAVVMSDKERIIDLCGIKGGYNSGTFPDTKTLFIRVPVEVPSLVRKTSQYLGLRSEASSIFERGVNAGGTIDTLNRCVNLILELAGGKIMSEVIDIKEKEFKAWKLSLRLERLAFILGIEIPEKDVISILKRLNLSPVIKENKIIECIIPTYRNDLQIEEDLIEEVARLYGYNKFPLTLPSGYIPVEEVPYFKDYSLKEKVKQIMLASNFSEIYTYSLMSEKDCTEWNIQPDHILRIDNPVSREYEYLRPDLKPNLVKALRQNRAIAKEINLFELGKVYLGKSLDKTEEVYHLAGISNTKSFFEIKGIIEYLFIHFNITQDPANYIEIIDEGIYFAIPYQLIAQNMNQEKVFIPLPKYPPVLEDLALLVKDTIKVGDIISEIKKQSPLIYDVTLLDVYEDTKTFHIVYMNKEKNLTTEEVSKIREKILTHLQKKLKIKAK